MVQHPRGMLHDLREHRVAHLTHPASYSEPGSKCNPKSPHATRVWWNLCTAPMALRSGSRRNSHGERSNLGSTRSRKRPDARLVVHLEDCIGHARLVKEALELHTCISMHALGKKGHSRRPMRPEADGCEDSKWCVSVLPNPNKEAVRLDDRKPVGR